MKILSYFSMLFLCSLWGILSSAQGDFAPIGAEWCFGSTHTFNDAYVHYSKYYSEKDTVILGQGCRKISGYSVYPNRERDEWSSLYVYSTPDTIYCYNDSFQRFVPMYIFNVSTGDTQTYHVSIKFDGIPGSSWSDSLFQVVVTKVDSVYVDGIYLRQVWTSPVENWGFIGSYIERIGSTYAILGNVFLGSFPETYHRELRSYEDSVISYQHNEYDCEYLPTTSVFQETDPGEIRVYPNPHNGKFSIEMQRQIMEKVAIKLTDVSGRQFYLTTTDDDQQLHIDMSSFPAGIYLLTLNHNEKQSYFKIIKN